MESTSRASSDLLSTTSLNSTVSTARRAAALFSALRAHFSATAALEVSTPVLSCAGITDPNIHSLSTSVSGSFSSDDTRYFHTSPEFAMKRLLCAGCGDIYQICTVFRDGEQGRIHHPEFLMCEWYRIGLDHHQLMREMDTLLSQLWNDLASEHVGELSESVFISYDSALEAACGLRLAELDVNAIETYLLQAGVESPLSGANSLDDWLDLLMTSQVFSTFPQDRFTFLYDYPATQAALARTGTSETGHLVAQRFEVFHGSIELANGFYELNCETEQRSRFEHELQRRAQLGLPAIPIDEQLLTALHNGLPDCSGVALGLERLLMVMHGAQSLRDVMCLSSEDG